MMVNVYVLGAPSDSVAFKEAGTLCWTPSLLAIDIAYLIVAVCWFSSDKRGVMSFVLSKQSCLLSSHHRLFDSGCGGVHLI